MAIRVQPDPMSSDRHSWWTAKGVVPLIPPPVGAPLAPAAPDASEAERDARAFLASFVTNGELRLRRRERFVWVRVDSGKEEVANRYNVECRVWRWFDEQPRDEAETTLPTKIVKWHRRAVVDAVWRLCEAPKMDAISAEDAGCRFLAYHACDALRFENGTWRDTFGLRHYDLPLAEVRPLARKFLKALRFAEGVPDRVTAADINALLASAAQQSSWLASMQTQMAA